jgi:hypothetical protein
LIGVFLSSFSIADQIHVSENFQNHSCEEIEYLSTTGSTNDKNELIKPLKEKAKKLGANSLIKVKYSQGGIFGSNFEVEGIAAKCDLANSPSFFIKSPSVDTVEIKTTNALTKRTSFIGINYGASSFKFNISESGAQNNSNSYSMSPSNVKVLLGKYIDNKRISFGYTHFNTASDTSINVVDASYDRIFSYNNIKLFAGGSLSQITFTIKDLKSKGYSKNQLDISGIQLSVNLGVLYELNYYSELEIGVKQSLFTNNQDSIASASSTFDMDIDSLSQFYMGYNFKF